MRIIKKNVYYCDFCKKKSLRSLKTHEKYCTANPDRECRLCEGPSIKPIIEKYKKYFTIEETERIEGRTWHTETHLEIKVIYHKEFTLQDIINELNCECPNCIFTIIRCLKLNRYFFKKKYKYNYKKELEGWWSDVRAAQEEANHYDYY